MIRAILTEDALAIQSLTHRSTERGCRLFFRFSNEKNLLQTGNHKNVRDIRTRPKQYQLAAALRHLLRCNHGTAGYQISLSPRTAEPGAGPAAGAAAPAALAHRAAGPA